MYLIERVQSLLVSPTAEWPAIKREALSVAKIYVQYLLVFAALPAIGYLLSFVGAPNFIVALRLAIISYIVWLLTFNFAAIVVDRLAPTFDSTRSTTYSFVVVLVIYFVQVIVIGLVFGANFWQFLYF
jgi:hypothetical protein